jgi:Ca-activated chloride channel family protein
MLVAAALMIVAGVIGPRWGLYLEKQKVHGVDIVVALDVSRSMLARDVEPNRMERAKRELRQQLVERAVFQNANRLALLAFAGSTSLKLPLTTDHLAFRTKLAAVGVGSAARGGTDIGEAIRRAAELFTGSPEEATRIILLLTDGEDQEGQAHAAAAEVYERDRIRVFTVGVGDPAWSVGAEIPVEGGGQPLLHDGQIVFSKLAVGDLKAIAETAGGRYAPIGEFHRLVQEMAGMKRTELTTEERLRHRPRYQWFVAAALLLLGLETLIGDRRALTPDRPLRAWQETQA